MAVDVSREGHIARVGLNVPETKNALSPKVLLDLCQLWDEFQNDDSVRVVVLYSALPDIFCAGLDLSESVPFLTGEKAVTSTEEAYLFGEKDRFKGLSKALLKVKTLDRPVIAAINGWCITAGFEMAMGCEFRVATADARFQMRETRLGVIPMSGSNVLLPAQVGSARALEILVTGDVYPAATLHAWGFLNGLVASRDELLPEAMRLAEKIAALEPQAVRGIVRLHHASAGLPFRDALEKEIEIALPVYRCGSRINGVFAQEAIRQAAFEKKCAAK